MKHKKTIFGAIKLDITGKTYLTSKSLEQVWEVLRKCERETWTISIARGCYKRINSIDRNKLKKEYNLQLSNGPHIFVAFDRVEESAKEISEYLGIDSSRSIGDILTITLVHETFHVFTDLNGREYLGEPWFRIIEKSLANYTAYLAIENTSKAIFLLDTEKQPMEYKCWSAWRNTSQEEFFWISLSWARKNPSYLLSPISFTPWGLRPLTLYYLLKSYFTIDPPEKPLQLIESLHFIYQQYGLTAEILFSLVTKKLLRRLRSLEDYWKFFALGILMSTLFLM